MQFEVMRKNHRREQRHEDATGGAAGREREVVAREAINFRTKAVDFAVADHAADKECTEVEGALTSHTGKGGGFMEFPQNRAQ